MTRVSVGCTSSQNVAASLLDLESQVHLNKSMKCHCLVVQVTILPLSRLGAWSWLKHTEL